MLLSALPAAAQTATPAAPQTTVPKTTDPKTTDPKTTAPQPAAPQAPAQQPAAPKPTPPQPAPPQEPAEAFRLRIANTLNGGIELSVDKGANWLLVGRVARPATATSAGVQSPAAEVQRSSPLGMAFGVGNGRQVRLLPDSPAGRKDTSAILANTPGTSALFKDFLPAVGSPVELVSSTGRETKPLPSPYTPRDDDRFQFTVKTTALPADKIGDYAKDAAQFYRERAIARLRAKGKSPSTGSLTVTAKLSPGDTPDAVTFLLDGATAAIMNRPPYTMKWDTKEWTNGEHLIEIRALSASGSVLTRSKALVVVDNSK